jgi:hypothetical protein
MTAVEEDVVEEEVAVEDVGEEEMEDAEGGSPQAELEEFRHLQEIKLPLTKFSFKAFLKD